MGRRRRWLGRGLLGLALTGGAGVGGGALWLRTPAGQEALRGLVVEQVSGLMEVKYPCASAKKFDNFLRRPILTAIKSPFPCHNHQHVSKI